MKHLWIKKDPYEGTLHEVIGFYAQDMSHCVDDFHAVGQDLVNITSLQISNFCDTDVFSKRENMWAYDSSEITLKQVANPEWPYPEE